MNVRAKFTCQAKRQTIGGYYDSAAQKSVTGIQTTIEMYPVQGVTPENKEFFASTPSGKLEIGILRPGVAEMFELGKSYYVDFTEAPA